MTNKDKLNTLSSAELANTLDGFIKGNCLRCPAVQFCSVLGVGAEPTCREIIEEYLDSESKGNTDET